MAVGIPVKVLITGGAGFIGSAVARACFDAGVTPVILDSLAVRSRAVLPRSPFFRGDIADGNLVDGIFAMHPEISAAVHCAALTSVPDSAADPARYWRVNVTGTREFARSLLRNGCQRLVFSSSAAVYAPGEQFVSEDSPVGPQSPYAWTKAAAEEVLAAMAGPVHVIALRYFNPIGPGQQEGVLREMIRAHREVKPFVITGTQWPTRDGTGLRDYVDVRDLASAHIAALCSCGRLPDAFTTVNLGSGTGTTVRELLGVFSEVTGYSLETAEAGPRPGDVAGSAAWIDRARNLLGWAPAWKLADSIQDALR